MPLKWSLLSYFGFFFVFVVTQQLVSTHLYFHNSDAFYLFSLLDV